MKLLFMSLIMLMFSSSKKIKEILIFQTIMLMTLYNWTNFNFGKLFSMSIMMDFISINMVVLTFLLILISLMLNDYLVKSNLMKNLIVIMLIVLLLLFMTCDWLLFFTMFEFSLVPISLMIIYFGYQPERIEAFYYIFFYTIFVSLPLLIMMLYFKASKIPFAEHFDYFISFNFFFLNNWSTISFLVMFFAMCVKIPMFLFHSWLPKAHVEAPLIGSILLAGILLKMGGYGIYRMLDFWKPILLNLEIKYFLFSISMWGMLLICLLCLLETDMKSIIAYSSISHMNFMLSSVWMWKMSSLKSSLLMMMSHGFTSSFLFYLVNCCYLFTHSRSLFLNKYFISMFPMLTSFWFMALCMNSGIPPSSGMLSELIISISLVSVFFWSMILIFFYLIFSGVYSMYLYVNLNHGDSNWYNMIYKNYLIKHSDYLVMFLHMFFSLGMIWYSYMVIF
uniref:NADH-ubiquinone oxidoreductase chain 4 n=1 Tax=Heterodoxus macropus TaxID=145266 RepID=Q9B8G5_9NEOP|nr:NADH dehydrogenase subunit 4 [Heterodoxus macropus]